MGDVDGPHVARTVYERLFSSNETSLRPDTVPYALDDAVRQLRDNGVPPERWALFIHVGI